jgi:hypothetical protein
VIGRRLGPLRSRGARPGRAQSPNIGAIYGVEDAGDRRGLAETDVDVVLVDGLL